MQAPPPRSGLAVLWAYFRRFLRHRRRLFAGFACIPFAAVAEVGITLLIGSALDRLRAGADTSFLVPLALLVVAIAVARGVLRFFQRWWTVSVSRWFEVELKQELFEKLVTLPRSFWSRAHTGDVVTRLTADVENVRSLLGPGLMQMLGSLVVLPVSLAVLVHLDARVTLLLCAPLAALALVLWRLLPRLHRWSRAAQESLSALAHCAQDSLAGVRVVQGYGVERERELRFAALSERNRDDQVALARARATNHAASHLAKDVVFVPIVLVGGLAMLRGELPAGDLFVFIDLTFKVFWPVLAVGWVLGSYPRALASAQRLDELAHEESERDAPRAPRPTPANGRPRGALSLRGVGYTYPGAAEPALEDVDVELPAGAMLGVVGPTGAGKSTFVHALGGIVEAHGELLLDGVPFDALSAAELRAAQAHVPQDGFLFSDTWRANVELGAQERLSDAELAVLAERVALADEVRSFEGGFDQLIGERGVTLSGGQRQRTCIARALASDAPLLVLDDALSSVDGETEARLLETLRAERGRRSLVVVAHRLSAVREADEILVLERGRVTARGTHEECLARSAWYRAAWERQRAADEWAEDER